VSLPFSHRIWTWLFCGVAAAGLIGVWGYRHFARRLQEELYWKHADEGRRAVMGAVMRNDPTALDRLLREYPEEESSLDGGLTHAVMRGEINLASMLLDHGCSPDGLQRDGTPLMIAVASGRSEMVDLLLRNGASLDVTDLRGVNPLIAAVISNQPRLAERLLRAGSPLNRQANVIRSLPRRSQRGAPSEAGTADSLRNRSDLVTYRKSVSAIMYAAWSNQPDMVRMLLKYCPDLTLKTREGETALDLAQSEGNREVVALLRPRVFD
jgi:FOG: Ankyrin repeat